MAAITTKSKKQKYKVTDEMDSMGVTMEEKCSVEKREQVHSYVKH